MDGDRQLLGKRTEEPYPDLFCVFVALGENNTKDRYFMFSWSRLAEIVVSNHKNYLAKHSGFRPRVPKSTHCSISISELQIFENQWNSILEAIEKKRIKLTT